MTPCNQHLSRRIAIAVVCAVVLPSFAVQQETLRAAASTAWNMPFGDFEGERMVGGIYFDLYKAIAQKTGLTLLPVVLPRKRVEEAVANGEIDLRCYLNPAWTSTPDAYVWSKPLFSLQDVLFGHEGTPKPLAVKDIPRGTKVSTVLGYRYPTLDPLFARGDLRRDDSVDEEKVLLKMSMGRTLYGVTKSNALDWYRRKTPAHQLAAWRLVVDDAEVYCAVPKNASVPAARLLDAIEDLRKTGRIDAILRNYR